MQKKLFLALLLITSCSTADNASVDVSLNPYLTDTPAPTNTPNVLVVETTPIPTSTPHLYIVQQGDTFSEIAESFNISISDLRAANPEVNPNAMPVGETLIIPNPAALFAAASTPTPAPVPITQTVCYADSSAGAHCFALIHNNTNHILENVSARISLLDETNAVIASETAFTILDIIPAHSSLPAYIYFPNVNQKVNPQAQLLSAVQGNSNNYATITLNNSVTEIYGDYATVSGQAHSAQPANEVWIAAVAYDQNGVVVGVRRWESREAAQAGAWTPFRFSVSSVGRAIEAVEFFVQAK